jgi:hypothetical protein
MDAFERFADHPGFFFRDAAGEVPLDARQMEVCGLLEDSSSGLGEPDAGGSPILGIGSGEGSGTMPPC